MTTRRWKVRVLLEEAALEVAFLFTNEDVKDEVNRVLKLLASQDDPRSPFTASGLDVSELVDDAPGWYRVKVPRYGIRIVFRLLMARDEQFLPIKRDQPLTVYEEGDECYIEVMQAGYRKSVYGEELRQRHFRLN